MGFFFTEQKREEVRKPKAAPKVRLEDIPVTTMARMGCDACPRNDGVGLRSPKMRPEGPENAPVYVLGTSPSQEDDEDDLHWRDEATREVVRFLSTRFFEKNVRSNYIMQCRGTGDEDTSMAATVCCRSRIIADIEAVKPLIVVTIGDAPLQWATRIPNITAPHYRGAPHIGVFGKHVCWVWPVMYPKYVAEKRAWKFRGKRPSTFEQFLEHDLKWVREERYDELAQPVHYSSKYDEGIELLAGDGAGMDLRRLEQRLVQIAQLPVIALDIETNGLRPHMLRDPKFLTVSVGTFDDVLAFPLDLPGAWATESHRHRAWQLYAEFLLASGRKTCHHVGCELEWHGSVLGTHVLRRTEWDDTMLMSHALNEGRASRSLGALTARWFGFNLKEQSRVDVKREAWWTLYPLKEILRYNGMDVKWTFGLRKPLMSELKKQKLMHLYEQRIRLAPALVATELPGLLVDEKYAARLDREMRDKMRDADEALSRCREVQDYEREYRRRFSPSNDHHVLELMKDLLRRVECRCEDPRTGFVSWSTDEEALSAMPKNEVPSARIILERREVAKLHGTYVLPVLNHKIVGRDGKIHSKYSSVVAVTSRLSSEDPNAQNFPKRKHKYVRGMVIAADGHSLMPCDYGQIEFRVVGMCSKDENLVRYCWTGYDVHKFWAERFVKVHPPIIDWVVNEFEVDWDKDGIKTLRQEAKNKWVFPQLFGSSHKSCATNLHLPPDVAERLAGEFWDEFPGVKKWQQDLQVKYDKKGYVETLNGRRRRGPQSFNEMVNMPIQGTAAEIVQEAHMALSERADAEGDPQINPVLNVHDDLTFHVRNTDRKEKVDIIVREMCLPRFDWINVPLLVEVSCGSRWDNAEEVGKFYSHEVFGEPNPYSKK